MVPNHPRGHPPRPQTTPPVPSDDKDRHPKPLSEDLEVAAVGGHYRRPVPPCGQSYQGIVLEVTALAAIRPLSVHHADDLPSLPPVFGPAEQQALDHLGTYASDASGYAPIQGTRPQTLGMALPTRQSAGDVDHEKLQGRS